RIRAQMEGAAIMGLSLALSSEITFEAGQVRQSNFHDYEVLRLAQAPKVIRTHLVNDDHALPPGGVGEPPITAVAPALCNAICARWPRCSPTAASPKPARAPARRWTWWRKREELTRAANTVP